MVVMERRACMARDAASAEWFRVLVGGAENDASRAFGRVKERVHQMEPEIGNHQKDQKRRQHSPESLLSNASLFGDPIHMRYKSATEERTGIAGSALAFKSQSDADARKAVACR